MKKSKIKVDELVDVINNSKLYQEYKAILEEVEKSKVINQLVTEIKALQKKAVNEEYHQDHLNLAITEAIIDHKLKELYNISLYKEYIEKSTNLNNLIKKTTNHFQNYFNDI